MSASNLKQYKPLKTINAPHDCGAYRPGVKSHIEIDGPNFVPKSGYFLLIWVKVYLEEAAFSYFLNQLYELAFQTKC